MQLHAEKHASTDRHEGTHEVRVCVAHLMPRCPLTRASAVRRPPHSSPPNAAVYSCYLHGFCTNGLGDTGFVQRAWTEGECPIDSLRWWHHSPKRAGSTGVAAVHTSWWREGTRTRCVRCERTCRAACLFALCWAGTGEGYATQYKCESMDSGPQRRLSCR